MNYIEACGVYENGDNMFRAGVRIRIFHAIKIHGDSYDDAKAITALIRAVTQEIAGDSLPG